MKENPWPLAPEGIPFLAIALAATALVYYFAGPWAAILPGLALVFTLQFFRDPKRFTPPSSDQDPFETVISPADGTIIGIQEVEEGRLLHRRLRRVSIFMSPFNVHVNRAPVHGEVTQTQYNPGKFFNAAADKASLDNEQRAIVMKTARGVEVLFVLIAGFIARRIVSYPKSGDRLYMGQRIGMIRFGSRVDVYLPLNAEVAVGMKQRVTAGETLLARLPNAAQ